MAMAEAETARLPDAEIMLTDGDNNDASAGWGLVVIGAHRPENANAGTVPATPPAEGGTGCQPIQ
jgi:hypothetical protein